MSWTAWTIVKADSQRVPAKNLRSLHGQPLVRWILQTLHAVPEIDRIVVNTDAPDRFGPLLADLPRVVLRARPDDLRGPRVGANALLARDVAEVPELMGERVLMTHATNPLLRAATVRAAIGAFEASDADSLFTVTRRQARHFLGPAPVNHDPAELLPTQDLQPVDEENSCLYLVPTAVVRATGRRIGPRAMRFPIPAAEAVDIDAPEDWYLAERIARGRSGPPAAVLFDLDGTLIHSLPDVARALSDALAAEGLGPWTADDLKPWLGQGARALIAGALRASGRSEARAEALEAAFLARYRAHPMVATEPFAGVEAMLDRLAADGVALGICTNKPWATAEPVLDALGWRERFGVVLTPRDAPRKPDPAMLHQALDALKAPSAGAVYVGDSEADRDAAVAAGLPFAWARWGYATGPLTGEVGLDDAAHLEALLPELAHWGRPLGTWTPG